MSDALERERDRIEKAIRDEFEDGLRTRERLEAIAAKHCGEGWNPIVMDDAITGELTAHAVRRT